MCLWHFCEFANTEKEEITAKRKSRERSDHPPASRQAGGGFPASAVPGDGRLDHLVGLGDGLSVAGLQRQRGNIVDGEIRVES